MSLYSKLADLRLTITDYRLEPRELTTRDGWTRTTTIVRLAGKGLEGAGEDVTYHGPSHAALRKEATDLPLAGTYTLEEFSRAIDAIDPLWLTTAEGNDRLHRRWAFESAALDLALRQAGTSLAGALGRELSPVTFVVSLGLGDPPGLAPIRDLRERDPNLRFKVDLSESWTEALVEDLAGCGAVVTVDLKGHYRGSFTGPRPDPAQYRWIAERVTGAWIEDPWLDDETMPALDAHRERITWDAVLHSVADIIRLPFEPRCINIKPSRFGFLSELFRVYDYCETRGISMYGGGQFELGEGRRQIQYLASLFHPDAANDVAPSEFNRPEPGPDLPTSPLGTLSFAASFGVEPG